VIHRHLPQEYTDTRHEEAPMRRRDRPDDTIVASFVRPEVAKAAIADLERVGIGSNDMTVLNDVSGTRREVVRRADDRKVRWVARRWAWGAVIGAATGVLVFLGALVLVHDGSLYPAWIPTVIGGAVAGAFVGGLLWVGATMPRAPQAWDTHLVDDGAVVRIAVRLRHPDTGARVTAILRRRGASIIDHPPQIS
jgi:hypothetical protein